MFVDSEASILIAEVSVDPWVLATSIVPPSRVTVPPLTSTAVAVALIVLPEPTVKEASPLCLTAVPAEAVTEADFPDSSFSITTEPLLTSITLSLPVTVPEIATFASLPETLITLAVFVPSAVAAWTVPLTLTVPPVTVTALAVPPVTVPETLSSPPLTSTALSVPLTLPEIVTVPASTSIAFLPLAEPETVRTASFELCLIAAPLSEETWPATETSPPPPISIALELLPVGASTFASLWIVISDLAPLDLIAGALLFATILTFAPTVKDAPSLTSSSSYLSKPLLNEYALIALASFSFDTNCFEPLLSTLTITLSFVLELS